MKDEEFIDRVATKAGLTNEEAETFIAAFVQTLGVKLKEKPLVEVEGIGNFQLTDGKIIFQADKEIL